MFPGFGDVEHGFPDFHNFSLNSGKPLATILVTTQERCRMCGKTLAVDPDTHIVVIHHEQRGSYLGSRVTKCCRTCKVYEHYGYWTQEGQRHFNDDCVSNKFLLSTEGTAFQNTLVKHAVCELFGSWGCAFHDFCTNFQQKFRILRHL